MGSNLNRSLILALIGVVTSACATISDLKVEKSFPPLPPLTKIHVTGKCGGSLEKLEGPQVRVASMRVDGVGVVSAAMSKARELGGNVLECVHSDSTKLKYSVNKFVTDASGMSVLVSSQEAEHEEVHASFVISRWGSLLRETEWTTELFRDYHPNGKPFRVTELRDGLPHGMHREYGESGTLLYEAEFKDGALYSGTSRSSMTRYVDGRLHMVEAVEHPDVVDGRRVVHIDGRIPTESGVLIKPHHKEGWRIEAPYNDQGRMHGSEKTLSSDGKVVIETTWQDGLVHGAITFYYDDGTVYFSTPYRNGIAHGEKKTFSDVGRVTEQSTYVDGLLEGESKRFDGEGKLQSITHYRNGEMHGDLKYFVGGELVLEATYLQGFKHGLEKRYLAGGELHTQEEYFLGAPVNPTAARPQ